MRSPTLPSFHVAPSPPSTRSRPSPYLLPTASPLSSTFPSAVSSPAASPTSPTFVASGDEVSSEHHVIDVAPTPPIGSRGSPAFPRPRSLRPFLPSPFSPSSPRFDDAEPDDGEMDIADHRLADSGPTAPTVGLPLLGDDTITVARSPTFFNRPHVVSSPRLRRLVSSPNLPRSPEADGGVPVTGGLPNRKWEIVATPSEEDGSSGTIGGIVGLGLLDVDPEQQAESRHPGADDRQGEETVGLGLGFEFEGLGVEGAQGTAADLPSWTRRATVEPIDPSLAHAENSSEEPVFERLPRALTLVQRRALRDVPDTLDGRPKFLLDLVESTDDDGDASTAASPIPSPTTGPSFPSGRPFVFGSPVVGPPSPSLLTSSPTIPSSPGLAPSAPGSFSPIPVDVPYFAAYAAASSSSSGGGSASAAAHTVLVSLLASGLGSLGLLALLVIFVLVRRHRRFRDLERRPAHQKPVDTWSLETPPVGVEKPKRRCFGFGKAYRGTAYDEAWEDEKKWWIREGSKLRSFGIGEKKSSGGGKVSASVSATSSDDDFKTDQWTLCAPSLPDIPRDVSEFSVAWVDHPVHDIVSPSTSGGPLSTFKSFSLWTSPSSAHTSHRTGLTAATTGDGPNWTTPPETPVRTAGRTTRSMTVGTTASSTTTHSSSKSSISANSTIQSLEITARTISTLTSAARSLFRRSTPSIPPVPPVPAHVASDQAMAYVPDLPAFPTAVIDVEKPPSRTAFIDATRYRAQLDQLIESFERPIPLLDQNGHRTRSQSHGVDRSAAFLQDDSDETDDRARFSVPARMTPSMTTPAILITVHSSELVPPPPPTVSDRASTPPSAHTTSSLGSARSEPALQTTFSRSKPSPAIESSTSLPTLISLARQACVDLDVDLSSVTGCGAGLALEPIIEEAEEPGSKTFVDELDAGHPFDRSSSSMTVRGVIASADDMLRDLDGRAPSGTAGAGSPPARPPKSWKRATMGHFGSARPIIADSRVRTGQPQIARPSLAGRVESEKGSLSQIPTASSFSISGLSIAESLEEAAHASVLTARRMSVDYNRPTAVIPTDKKSLEMMRRAPSSTSDSSIYSQDLGL